ncbi:MAG: response regulator [Tannerellaceae bacterium]|nr:response regulator [Tannerellaceae bacterium]
MMENNEGPFRVAIIDNDEMEIDELMLILKTYPDLEIVGTSKVGAMGKRLILNKKPDLLFLDIQLPDTDGVTLLDSIRDSIDWKMQVVFFTTSNISYVLQAVRKSVFDCLLKPIDKKPIDKKELESIVNRFYKERAKKRKPDTRLFKSVISVDAL